VHAPRGERLVTDAAIDAELASIEAGIDAADRAAVWSAAGSRRGFLDTRRA
jgi:hypothetical protein